MIIESPVKIHQLIAHKVYHKTQRKPGLYDLESPINQALEDILRKQIIDNCNYKYTNSAVFDENQGGQVRFSEMCRKLFEDPQNFVSESQNIARHLFEASTQKTSESDLVICTFSEGGNKKRIWLALLKMEPQSGIIQEEKEQRGKKMAILTPVTEVLPTGYLQKCAFIRPFSDTKKGREKVPDLYVLDLQGGKYGSQKVEVASFFSKRFLQCRLDKSPAELTKAFFRGSHDWIGKKREKWPEANVIHFEEQVEVGVRSAKIDLMDFAQQAITNPEEQEEYFDYMRDKKGITAPVFKPDPQKRADLLKYTWFEGDNNILLRIATEALTNERIFSVVSPPGRPHKITITSSTWTRKYSKGRS